MEQTAPEEEAAGREVVVEVELSDTATDGRGVGRLADGKVVFVEGGIGGESVRVRVERDGSKLAEGRVEQVLRSSDWRQHPPCVQADRCGGCQLQHVIPAAQLTLKKQWLLQTLRRVGRWEPDHLTTAAGLLECRQTEVTGYRVRARWHFNGTTLGFFSRRSHDVVPNEGCLLLAPPLEEAREELLASLMEERLKSLYLEAGLLDLQMEATLLRGRGTAIRLCDLRCRHPGVEGKLRKKMELLVREWNRSVTTDEGLADVDHPHLDPFLIGPRDFVQPHRQALGLYREEILGQLGRLLQTAGFASLRESPDWTAWDLYCGAGAFSDLPGRAAGPGRSVTTWAVDGVASSLDLLGRNCSGLSLRPMIGDVRDFVWDRVEDGDLPDLVISDPPRSGIGTPTARRLSRALAGSCGPKALVWLACDPASFARDVKPFLEAGFRLHSLTLFDCFGYTAHFEVLCVLSHPGA